MAMTKGMTLIELMISVSVLSIISILGIIALQSSVRMQSLAMAEDEINSDLRNTINQLNDIVRQAYTEASVTATPPISPPGVESIQVLDNGKSIRFYLPERVNTPAFVRGRGPITISFENEDTSSPGQEGNAILDPGEDLNRDGALTRRLVVIEGNNRRPIGSANCISDVEFRLLPDRSNSSNHMKVLSVRLAGTKRLGPGLGTLIRSEIHTTIPLEN